DSPGRRRRRCRPVRSSRRAVRSDSRRSAVHGSGNAALASGGEVAKVGGRHTAAQPATEENSRARVGVLETRRHIGLFHVYADARGKRGGGRGFPPPP